MQKSRDKSVLRHFWKYQQHVKVAAYGKPCIKPRGFTAIVERVLCSRSRSLPFPFASHLAFFWRLPKHSYFLSRTFCQRCPRILPRDEGTVNLNLLHLNDRFNKLHDSIFCSHSTHMTLFVIYRFIFFFIVFVSVSSRSKSSSIQ